jgi:hypothetical protein
MSSSYLNAPVEVIFNYDTSKVFEGWVVRDDTVTIIALRDRRYVLGTECQYRLKRDIQAEGMYTALAVRAVVRVWIKQGFTNEQIIASLAEHDIEVPVAAIEEVRRRV